MRLVKTLTAIFISLLSGGATAQIVTSIVVVEEISGRVVPFAQIFLPGDTVIVCDSLGSFAFSSTLLSSSGDIIVRCLGFEDRRISAAFLSNSRKVALRYKPYEIAEVMVKPQTSARTAKKARSYQQNSKDGFTFVSYSTQPFEICTGVRISQQSTPVSVRSISIAMKKRRIDNPIRLHLYAADSGNMPGKELLDTNVLIRNKDVRKGYYTLTLTDRYPTATTSSVFVGLEFMNVYPFSKGVYPDVGPAVRCIVDDSPSATYARKNLAGPWATFFDVDEKGRGPNIMVALEYFD